jgi:L-lactate utilization protein LutC
VELAVDVRGDFIGCLAAAQGTEKVLNQVQQLRVQQVKDVTKVSSAESLHLLEANCWDMEAAVTMALDVGGVGDAAPAAAEQATKKPKPKGGAKRWISSSTRK